MNKDFINLATPTSHLFKSEVNADSISEKSDCLELREFMIGKIDRLNENVMLAHLDEVDITLPWDQERKALITDVIKNYQNLKKLPDEIEDAINELEESRELKESFGEDVIKSYVKLKNQEIESFNRDERFDKRSSITDWEKNNTLDC